MKKNILWSIFLMITLLVPAVFADEHDIVGRKFIFNPSFFHPEWGRPNGSFEVVLKIYDKNDTVLYEQSDMKQFYNGKTSYTIENENFIQEKSHRLVLTLPDFQGIEKEILLRTVPFSAVSKTTKSVNYSGIENIPDQIGFLTDHTAIENTEGNKSLSIHNKSQNNNTASSLSLSSDNGANYVNISSLKNNQGQQKTHISSKDDIEFYRDGKLVLKLGKDNFEMNGYSSLTVKDIANMGFLHSETQVDEFVNNNGYLKSADMSDYVTYDDLNFAGSNYQTSAAYGIGVYDQFDFSDSIRLQNVLKDFDSAIGNIEFSLSESDVDAMIANNGYALSSDSRFSDARTPLIASQTNGDLIYYKDGWKRLARGNDDQVLSLSSGYPVWKNEVIDTNTQLNDSDIANMGYIKYNSPINASNIMSGTIPDARLSSNVSKLGSSITDGEISGSISGSKISAGVNGSSITTGTISDNRLPDNIEGKSHIKSKDITVETLTVKTINYDTSANEIGSGGGSSIFSDYHKSYTPNNRYKALTDGFLMVACHIHNHRGERISIYADTDYTIIDRIDSHSNNNNNYLIGSFDITDYGGKTIYRQSTMVAIPKDYYFKIYIESEEDVNWCTINWVGIGG